jgi:hypothetical protein
MKSIRTLNILAATAFCLVANTSFAEYAIVTTKIIGLLPREKGLVIRIDAAGA